MSTQTVDWVWDSKPTLIRTPLGSLHGRILTTTLGTAVLYRQMNEDHLARLEGAQVLPYGTGWQVTGTNPATGREEIWYAEALPPDAKPCGCGSR